MYNHSAISLGNGGFAYLAGITGNGKNIYIKITETAGTLGLRKVYGIQRGEYYGTKGISSNPFVIENSRFVHSSALGNGVLLFINRDLN